MECIFCRDDMTELELSTDVIFNLSNLNRIEKELQEYAIYSRTQKGYQIDFVL